jgi:hypothetical protein
MEAKLEPLAEALDRLAPCLKRLGIRFAIGGSVASAAHGIVRATLAVDLIAIVHPMQSERLVSVLGRDWYAEAQQIRQALAARRSFNVIYMPRSVKVDIFPADDDFGAVQLERAQEIELPFWGAGLCFPVTTAEDILLAKLRWYAAGGEVSERQWRDITGILAVNPDLDFAYVNQWAERLGVAHLLPRAIADAAT